MLLEFRPIITGWKRQPYVLSSGGRGSRSCWRSSGGCWPGGRSLRSNHVGLAGLESRLLLQWVDVLLQLLRSGRIYRKACPATFWRSGRSSRLFFFAFGDPDDLVEGFSVSTAFSN